VRPKPHLLLGFYLKFKCLGDKNHPEVVALYNPPHESIQPTWPILSGDVVGLVKVTSRLRVLRIAKTHGGRQTHFEVVAETGIAGTGLIRGSNQGWVPHWHVGLYSEYWYEREEIPLTRFQRILQEGF
jgi:hypothetical protein